MQHRDGRWLTYSFLKSFETIEMMGEHNFVNRAQNKDVTYYGCCFKIKIPSSVFI